MEDIVFWIVLLLMFGGPILGILGWLVGIVVGIWELICEGVEGIGDFFRSRKRKKLEKKRKKEQKRREKLRKKHYGFASIDDVPQEKRLLEEMYDDHISGGDESRALRCAMAAGDLGSASCAYKAAKLLHKQDRLDEAERYAQKVSSSDAEVALLQKQIRYGKLLRDGVAACDAGSWQKALDLLKEAMKPEWKEIETPEDRVRCHYYAALAMRNLAETVAHWETAWKWVCDADESESFRERAKQLKSDIIRNANDDFTIAMLHNSEGAELLQQNAYEQALEHYLAAAELGSHRARFFVAFTYRLMGGKANLQEAMVWAAKARQCGDPDAEELIDTILDAQELLRATELYHDGQPEDALHILDKLIDKGDAKAAAMAAKFSYEMAQDTPGWERNIAYIIKTRELGGQPEAVQELLDDSQSRLYVSKAVDLIYDESGKYNLKEVLDYLDKATKLGHSLAPALAAKTLCETVINRTENKRYEYEIYQLCRERMDNAVEQIKIAKKMEAHPEMIQDAVDTFHKAEAALREYKGF